MSLPSTFLFIDLDFNRKSSKRASLITGIPHFLKVHFMSLPFYKRPTLIPVFANQKKSMEDFQFYEKRRQAKTVFSVGFAATVTEAARTPAARGAPPSSFLGTALSLSTSQHPAAIALNCVCEHLYFSSIYFVQLLARCVLSSLLLRFTPFQLNERFYRNILPSDSEENLYLIF